MMCTHSRFHTGYGRQSSFPDNRSPGFFRKSPHTLHGLVAVIVASAILVTSGRVGAEETIETIKVPPGFTVELAAGPPLVQHPIMAGFDDRGRLYVAEAAGLNLKADELLKELPNSIRRLEDTDGDGKFDKSTVFADKMTFPQGALWHRGSLYVASPPSIWKLTDENDDGVADRREEIVNKFGFTGNAADIHGCFLGPDGRIYWCDGRHGHDFPEKDGQPARKGLAARVFSCRLDGSDVQIFCGGGMDNPVEITFTEEGEMLGTMTFYNPDKDRHDAVVHFVHGGVYPKKHPCIEEFQRTGELMPAVSIFGVVAPSGLTTYRGARFGGDYQGNLFTTQFNTHKVIRQRLFRDGATFRSIDQDFLVSSSMDFHPTDVLEDADGSLLVIDTGGWFRIGCPTSQVAKPEILGGIYRVVRNQGPKMDDPRGLKIAWDEAPALELAAMLDDERTVVRERAIDTLAVRGGAGQAALETVLQRGSPRARRNAVWTLGRMETQAAGKALIEALADRDESVRQAVVRCVGTRRERAAIDGLASLVSQDRLPIRREAATALGKIAHPSAVPALLDSLRAGGDRFVEHATIYALIEIDDHSTTVAGLTDLAPQVRRGTLIALDQMKHGRLTKELVLPLLDTSDTALQAAALEVIGKHADWAEGIVGLLEGWLGEKSLDAEREGMLRGALWAFREDPRIQSLMAEQLSRETTGLPTRLLLLESMARSELKQLPESWRVQLEASLAHPEMAAVRQAIATAAALGGSHFDDRLAAIGQNRSQPAELRLAAWSALAGREPIDSRSFQFLLAQINDQQPPLVRLAACSALSSARLEADQLRDLAEVIAKSGPLETPLLVGAYEHSVDTAVGLALIAALRESPGLMSLSEEQIVRLVKRYPPAVRSAAELILARFRISGEEVRRRLAELEADLEGGDAAHGKEVFVSKKTACIACHRVAGQGEAIGPDLTRIGEVRSPRDLLEAIVFPSQSFARGYESYTISTDAGLTHTGVIGRETADSIYLRTPQRAEVRIPRATIEQMAPSRVSVMPQGLDKTMSVEELRDLVAYLKTLR